MRLSRIDFVRFCRSRVPRTGETGFVGGDLFSRDPGLVGSRSSRRLAFTLVEMLVVMAVIVILLAVTVPNFKNLIGGRTVEQSINSVTGVLELGHTTAVANRTCVYVLFSNSTNSDNNAELVCAVVASANGLNDLTPSNLRPVSKLIKVSNVKNVVYTAMPKAVQDVTPAEFKTDAPYIAGWDSTNNTPAFPDLVIGGYKFSSAAGAIYLRFADDGEIVTGDSYQLLVEPKVCLGLAKTVGTTVQTNATDGAIVVCYGGTAKMSVFRP